MSSIQGMIGAAQMIENDVKILTKILETARRKLLDTGTRNRLIHINRANQRSNSLNIVNEVSDEVYKQLRLQSKAMRFKALGQDSLTIESDDINLRVSDEKLGDLTDRMTDSYLETPLGPDTLSRRLLRLASDAKTAEEEQGINLLYLALGFLKWKESDSSEVVREAPLILLPVELTRNEKTSTFDISIREDDTSTNLPLSERFRQDFGLKLPEIDETDDWLPSAYFNQVRTAISGKSDWIIDENGIQLGFFSFAKLLMHRDLEPSNWPDGALINSPLFRSLLRDGFDEDEPIFGPDDKLDEKLTPADIIQVVDADASQTKVIEEVRRGASLVVQGPPGTGKSQTITNIIAAAAHDGKTILFVAEKMAALSVVHDRLVKVGLRDICIELHSRSANKKALALELGRTLSASSGAIPQANNGEKLRLVRDQLNSLSASLHTPFNEAGDTPFSTLSELICFLGNEEPPPVIKLEGLSAIGKSERTTVVDVISKFIDALKILGSPDSHPFRDCENLGLQPTDLERLKIELSSAISSLRDLISLSSELAVVTGLPVPHSLAVIAQQIVAVNLLSDAPENLLRLVDIFAAIENSSRMIEALEAGKAWSRAFANVGPLFKSVAWETDTSSIRSAISRGQASWFYRIFGGYRAASTELASILEGTLPASPKERLKLIDQQSSVKGLKKRLADEEIWLQRQLLDEWRGDKTPFSELLDAYKWFANTQKTGIFTDSARLKHALASSVKASKLVNELSLMLQKTLTLLDAPLQRLNMFGQHDLLQEQLNSSPFTDLLGRIEQMSENPESYVAWRNYRAERNALARSGAAEILVAIESGAISKEHAQREFLYACAEARWDFARNRNPELDELRTLDRHKLVQAFKELELERISTAKNIILSKHFEQVPRGAGGEMAVIRGEIGRKRGHKPIRWVMSKAGSMVQRIKPVFLASPISVAQFLPPGSLSFDLLVIDEASQVRPEDALGLIGRAKQIVVVGDQKQLPPTSFFDHLGDDSSEEEDDELVVGATAADMESILSLCESKGLRQRMLEWHYRSKDPSLIRMSNIEFYEDRLVLPPSPLQLDPDYGLKFSKVAGVYAKSGSGLGRAGTNRIEAEAIADLASRHAREWPELSLGIVAFSKSQADMLTEILELRRRQDVVLDKFLREGHSEDVFVKNIENVQGDERDVILISVGYGPQEANGRLSSMNFGPINREGGERRLNVLFSRARIRCEVLASFDPADIDPSKSQNDGPRILKRFLDFAKTGIAVQNIPTGLSADSPFEEDVAAVISRLGYIADLQVGSAGFKIDIGVRHPDKPSQYLVAVECDGAAYHSALWARERDRLRQAVLENLGWKFHRIWSTDWFHNRKREIERLKDILDSTRNTESSILPSPPMNIALAHPIGVEPENIVTEFINLKHLVLEAPTYQRFTIDEVKSGEPHETPIIELASLINIIVEVEGPIHKDEVARRVSYAYGKSRTGNRIIDATNRAISSVCSGNEKLKLINGFLSTHEQFWNPPVRNRSNETGGLLKAEYLPDIEIKAAAKQITTENGSMPFDELVRNVANLLGFQRVGPELSDVLKAHLQDYL